MTEKPANKVRGFLLYDHLEDRHFFRVYGEVDPATGRKSFTDYNLSAEDIEVTIEATTLSLYECDLEDDKANRLSWSSKYLRKNKDVQS